MDVNEALSRLLSGELSEPDAAALRRRIEAEPALAAAWARLSALPDALAALPVPPGMPELAAGRINRPPALQPQADTAPVDAPRPRTQWPSLGWWVAPIAALALGYVLPHPKPHVVLAGEAVVQGPVILDLGATSVTIDGESRVRVEPARPLARGEGVEAPLDKTHLFSALAGAALTLAVDHGSATLRGPDGDRTVHTGERIEPPAADPTPDPGAPPTPERRNEALHAKVKRLEKELAAAKLGSAVANGQLAQAQGNPVPFPADVPAAYTAEGFEKNLRAALGEDAILLDIDCDEYPCLAVIEAKDNNEGWKDRLEAVADRMMEQGYGGAKAPSTRWISQTVGEEGTSSVMAFGMWSPDLPADDLQVRTKFRSETLLQALQPGAEE